MRAGALEGSLTTAREATGCKARQTDGSAAEWLAALLGQGRRKPSFIAPRPMGEGGELPRDRESRGRAQRALANRIEQLSARATLKLGQGASAALGGRGKLRLRAVAAGEPDAEPRSPWARRTLKRPPPQWPQARAGRLPQAQRWGLGQVLDPYEQGAAALTRAAERLTPAVESRR